LVTLATAAWHIRDRLERRRRSVAIAWAGDVTDLVCQIERKLIEDAVRPIIFFMPQGTCWQPEVKGATLMENSIFNRRQMEDVWLDQ
jgi:hypothetical protein